MTTPILFIQSKFVQIRSTIFFFTDPPPPEIYTFPYTTLFRSLEPTASSPAAKPGAGASPADEAPADRKSTRLNSSHITISYAVFCLKKKKEEALPRSNRHMVHLLFS